MSNSDLTETAAHLMDEIANDPMNWRAFEDRLRQIVNMFAEAGLRLPAQLKIYAGWLADEDGDGGLENLPV